VLVDDRSDPEVARTIYEGFVANGNMDFVFGPYSSAITSAIAPVVDRQGYPTLVAGASADGLWARGYKNLFGIYSPAGRYAMGFLAVLAEAGIKRVAIVSADDSFSVDASNGMQRWAPQYGLQIVHASRHPKGKADMVQAAENARRADAQALLVAGHLEESVGMRRALKQIGWAPRAYYATVGPAVQRYGTEVGADADGTFSTSIWEPREDLRYPGSADFLRRFIAAYGEQPSYHAATAYAAGQILEQAVQKTGSADRAAVRRTLAVLDVDNIIGRYAVDPTGMQIKRFPLIIQWRGGKREIVWPPEVRTAAPMVRN
jgi:branched-chain amino acid transport system substrate-binding protein